MSYRSFRTSGIVVIALTVFSGCAAAPWFKLGSNYTNNGISSPATATGALAWTFNTGLAIEGGAVLDSANNVYITSANGSAYAVTKDGAQIWQFSTAGPSAVRTTPAFENGHVYVGADDGSVYALDATSGKQVWTFKAGGSIVASIAPSDNVVYAASVDHKLYCLDSTTGKKLWEFQADAEIDSSPAQAPGGELYFGASDNKLYALNAGNGKSLWSRSTGGTITAAPAVGLNDSVFVGSDDGIFHAFDSTGNELWQFNSGASGRASVWSPAAAIFLGGVNNQQVIYVANGFTVAALDSVHGAVIWQNPPWFNGLYVSQPAVVPNGSLYITNTSVEGGAILVAADSKTGALQWSALLGGSKLNTPAVGLDGKVYVTSGDGNLYAVK
jgi:eukaryotic-like serine/threonine-protein kinase